MVSALTAALEIPAPEPVRTISAENFEQIVRQYQRRVYRFLLMLVRDQDTADTLTQECFLRAFQYRQSFRGECSVETWILRIAVNLAKDHGKNRRISFWKRLIGFDGDNHISAGFRAPNPSPERILLAREEVQAVLRACDRLSDQQRAIFLMRFSEEMQLAEIAAVLGIRTGSVKAQLSRAVARVRKLMREQQ